MASKNEDLSKQTTTATRSKNKVWLIGFPLSSITGARLPSGRDVMRNFVYYHRLGKLTISDSANKVFVQVMHSGISPKSQQDRSIIFFRK